jgi:protein-L-isoaspartate(D-aspartate) O-methyltransferase
MAYLDFVSSLHNSTKRDYRQRVINYDKAECAVVAKQYGADYWDGDRQYGYGGYRYDGRWFPVAAAIAKHYGLKPGQRVLDIGCGKGYLLYELTRAVPGIEVFGIDISGYAVENAKEEVRPFLQVGGADKLPYPDWHFDLVVSLTTFHNLKIDALFSALAEAERVGRGGKYIMIESYRNEREKVNLLYWQLTCESFYSPEEWQWLMAKAGYTGDYGCIYFE